MINDLSHPVNWGPNELPIGWFHYEGGYDPNDLDESEDTGICLWYVKIYHEDDERITAPYHCERDWVETDNINWHHQRT